MLDRNSLIESGAYKEYKRIRREVFNAKLDPKDVSLFPFSEEETKELQKMYEAHKKRNKRMYEKLCTWIYMKKHSRLYKNYHLIFATMTFTDQQMDNTSEKTRRRYIVRYLNSVSEHYIANIDFGAENGREHYHALIFTSERLGIGDWKKGFAFYEEVKFKSNDYIKTIKYLNKLTNHSFKDSNKTYKVIYDRNNDDKIKSWAKLIANEEIRKYIIQNKKSYL